MAAIPPRIMFDKGDGVDGIEGCIPRAASTTVPQYILCNNFGDPVPNRFGVESSRAHNAPWGAHPCYTAD